MNRRRLLVVSSDDEDDDDNPCPPLPTPPPPQQHWLDEDDLIAEDIESDFQTVTLNSANPTPGSNNSFTAPPTATHTQGNHRFEPIPLDISDEDREDVSTGDNAFPEATNGNHGHFQVSESPAVDGVLKRLGLSVRGEWLDSCLQGLQASTPGFQRMDDSSKAKLCFKQLFWSDMNFCGAGVLPPNVHTLHLVDLKGPFVLQVDEAVNISNPVRGRYQNAAPGIKRCLKLSMTDGIQRVFGMEYRPIKDLQVLGPAGLKVVVCNVHVRHGLLMLVPEVIEVLGGAVDELEAARQRLVEEINKPPRGRRNRPGEVVPLTTRATLAAWPPSNDAVPGHVDNNRPTNVIPQQTSRQASVPANDMHRQDFATPINRNDAVANNTSHAPWPPEQDEIQGHTDPPITTHSRQGSSIIYNKEKYLFPVAISQCLEDFPIFFHDTIGPGRRGQDIEVPVYRSNPQPSTVPALQRAQSVATAQHINEPSSEVLTPLGGTRQGTPASYMPEEDVHAPVGMDDDEANTSSIHMDVDDISTVDNLEPHFILSGDKEPPFIYLASLSAKYAAIDDETSVVRGKIKCIITGVKGFQFKGRSTFELRVYIDDGSLISEILIDHNVVRNAIGYSTQEVSKAYEFPEIKRIKEAAKEFQKFLANFEGTLLVEMRRESTVPVAVEMDQGCPTSDARLLLERVKSLTSTPIPLNTKSLSP
ncbi:recQ-mediated genome instability protein 1-like isoform X2 [Salvia splendens]|uniref:recQ-mediated genome instability protein 1-like isoform X2 n=1 Tax=Salvia splendens TaxID=180675 RepID=UPI001C27CB73|nr:recQ-mediated genome instability protein 1-like isoform X2 [Salvia splendens]